MSGLNIEIKSLGKEGEKKSIRNNIYFEKKQKRIKKYHARARTPFFLILRGICSRFQIPDNLCKSINESLYTPTFGQSMKIITY